MTEMRKIAEVYVNSQVKTWNGHSSKVSKSDIKKAITKVTKALVEVKEASVKAAAK
jgi:hypothetical protein